MIFDLKINVKILNICLLFPWFDFNANIFKSKWIIIRDTESLWFVDYDLGDKGQGRCKKYHTTEYLI